MNGEESKKEHRDLSIAMRERIEQIERLAIELKELGKGVLVVEENARNILSFTYILRFGISDIAEITDA